MSPTILRRLAGPALIAAAAGLAVAAEQDPSRDGYYYPPVTSEETFARDLVAAPGADRAARVAFVTQTTRQQFEQAYAPRWAMFAKGDDADELIVVALDDSVFATLQRARAVMAMLSAPARSTRFFGEHDLADRATFYDMLKTLGFETLVLSDGRSWSHRVNFR